MNCTVWNYPHDGPLARYVKLQVVHVRGMLGTFSPPPQVSDPGMHHGTCMTHVPWCMPGSLTSGFLWSQWREKNVSGIFGACANRKFTYLARYPWYAAKSCQYPCEWALLLKGICISNSTPQGKHNSQLICINKIIIQLCRLKFLSERIVLLCVPR